MVDSRPSFTSSIGDFAGFPAWPLAATLMVFVSPLQDLSDTEIRSALSVPNTAVFQSSFASEDPPGTPDDPG